MEKSKKILIGAGVLAFLGYFLYKKYTTKTISSTTSVVSSNSTTPLEVVTTPSNNPVVTPVITTTKAPTNKVVNPIIDPNSGKLVPPTSTTNPADSGLAGGSFDYSTKGSTLENSNSTLGDLASMGQDYTNNQNPTGYVVPKGKGTNDSDPFGYGYVVSQ